MRYIVEVNGFIKEIGGICPIPYIKEEVAKLGGWNFKENGYELSFCGGTDIEKALCDFAARNIIMGYNVIPDWD